MSDPPALELSLAQRFDMEHHTRVIDGTTDLGELRRLTKQLLQAWHAQKAATVWVMRQQLDAAHRLAFASPSPAPAITPQPHAVSWGPIL